MRQRPAAAPVHADLPPVRFPTAIVAVCDCCGRRPEWACAAAARILDWGPFRWADGLRWAAAGAIRAGFREWGRRRRRVRDAERVRRAG